jgi:hypothetical protein
MEKFPIDSGNGSRLASLIDHRLRGNQRLFLVSVDAAEPAGNAAREEVRKELLSLLDEMQRNVAASGVSERELDLAIDETVSNVPSPLGCHFRCGGL